MKGQKNTPLGNGMGTCGRVGGVGVSFRAGAPSLQVVLCE